MRELPQRKCVICGKVFTPDRDGRVCCAEPRCRKERKKQTREAWEKQHRGYRNSLRHKTHRLCKDARITTAKEFTVHDNRLDQKIKESDTRYGELQKKVLLSKISPVGVNEAASSKK